MESPHAVYDFRTWPNSVAACIMLISSIIGIVFNWAIIHNFFAEKNKNAFNLICVFRAVNNIYVLLVVILSVYIPESLLGYSIYPPVMESVIITTGVNMLVFNEFQSIFTAVNRLFAILFPIKYYVFFGVKPTLVFHILYYLDRTRNVTMENIDRFRENNFMTFSPQWLAYGGSIVAPDGMFIWALGLLVFPFLINLVTFIRFHYLKKRTSTESEHWKKAKKNMVLFLQTVIQDSLFSLNVFFTLKFNTVISRRFWTFFAQTLVWQLIHVFDGFIMLVFNEKITFFKKSKVSPVHTVGKAPERLTATVVVARPF